MKNRDSQISGGNTKHTLSPDERERKVWQIPQSWEGDVEKCEKKPSKVELSHDQGESFEGALDGWTKHPFPSFKPMIFREIGIQNTFRLHFL